MGRFYGILKEELRQEMGVQSPSCPVQNYIEVRSWKRATLCGAL
jgi:hypothetical protein